MRRLLIVASILGGILAGGLWGQFSDFTGRDSRWRTRGSGALASRPATCTASRDVWICVGSGCTSGKNVHYCTATNTWTEQGAAGGSGAPVDATYLTRTSASGLSDETAISGLATGFLHGTTATGAVTTRLIAAGTGVSISNGDGAGGNPVFNNVAPLFSAADAGGDDAYVVAPTGFPVAYNTGLRLTMTVATANTGAATIDAGPGAKAIKKPDGSTDPATGDIKAGPNEFVYDAAANGAAGAWIYQPQSGLTGNEVTAAGTLTADQPMFGDGSKAAKAGTKTGTGNEVVMSQSPTIVTPTISATGFTNAQHAHAASNSGGTLDAAAIAAGTLGTARLGSGTANSTKFLRGDSTWQTFSGVHPFGITIDGGGSAITTGVKGYVRIPYACTISKVSLLADQSGSIVLDVWKDTYANYPPTVADTITASAKPTLASATKAEDATLTGWTTAVGAGDTIGFNVDSATTVTRVHLIVECTI